VDWRLETFDSVHAFERVAGAFLAAHEAEHNLMLGLVGAIRAGRYPEAYLSVARRGDEIAFAALRTPPHDLALSRVTGPETLDLLVRDLAGVALPGVLAARPDAAAFAERWARAVGATVEPGMRQRIYVIDRLEPRSLPEGRPRVATAADRDRVVEWLGTFDASTAEAAAERLLSGGGDQTVLLWETDRPVSMAASGGPTPHGIRISAVYTPPEHRRRGYASAVTASLTQRMFDAGRRFCFLYTDLANPTSNRLYQRLGYRPVVDVDRLRFV